MYLIWVATIAVLVATSYVDAQSCKTPSGGEGDCTSLYLCQPLFTLFKKTNKTAQEIKLFKDSQCGVKQDTIHVCCPKSCTTPEGNPGQCIPLESCPHLLDMLKKPVAPATIQYIKRTVCTGPEEHSVCCGPALSEAALCGSMMSAYPPDARTDCCGVDARGPNRITGGSIVGGDATAIDEHPWMVAVEYTGSGSTKLFCGGSLISGLYVLTAAHCVVGPILKHGKPTSVRLGEYDVSNEGPDCVPAEAGGKDCTEGALRVGVAGTAPHPQYRPADPHRKHDIALIRLQKTAPFTDFIRPICLPTVDHTINPPPHFSLFVVGWGRYEEYHNETHLSKVKNHVELPYRDREVCQKSIDIIPKTEEILLWKGQLCAGGVAGKDSCRGASGGPLVGEIRKHNEVIGLVSFGAKKCGTPDIPGVYTNVYEYLPWIMNTIKP